MWQAILNYATTSNLVFFVAGLVIGIFILGKLTISEILKIIGEILPYMLKAEGRTIIGAKDGDIKMNKVLNDMKAELPAKHKGLLGVIWGGARNAAQHIFDKVAVPIINQSLIKRIR